MGHNNHWSIGGKKKNWYWIFEREIQFILAPFIWGHCTMYITQLQKTFIMLKDDVACPSKKDIFWHQCGSLDSLHFGGPDILQSDANPGMVDPLLQTSLVQRTTQLYLSPEGKYTES